MSGERGRRLREEPVDVLTATFNSAERLEEVFRAVRAHVPVQRLIVIDRFSTDGTAEIARRCGAEVHSLELGVGAAYLRGLELATTEKVLFVDSDVVIVRPDFFVEANRLMAEPGTGAVVGQAVGHRFLYGLPLSLTLVSRELALRAGMSLAAQGQGTYALRQGIRRDHLRIRYVLDAMRHYSAYRQVRSWPEWQGAQTRLVAGGHAGELLYSFIVVLLMHMNSRSPRNLAYTPIFWFKFLRGYIDPRRWRYLDRRRGAIAPAP